MFPVMLCTHCTKNFCKHLGILRSLHGFEKPGVNFLKVTPQQQKICKIHEVITDTSQGDLPRLRNGINSNHVDTFGVIARQKGITVFDQSSYTDTAVEEDVVIITKNEPFWFHCECKKLAKIGKVDECVNLLEYQMLKVEKVKPQEYNFSVVIGALGRVGDVQRAYTLYYKMKEYGLTASLPCITSLFNVVGNSTCPTDLIKVKKLQDELRTKNVKLHRNSYGALMKAYAKHGSFKNTLEVFHESMKNGIEPDDIYFAILLMSCRSSKENGFIHTIQVWKTMLDLGIQPTAPIIMSFLQAVKQCGIRDTDLASRLLLQNADPIVPKDFISKNFRQFMSLKGQKTAPKRTSTKPLDNFKSLPSFQDLVSMGSSTTEERDTRLSNIPTNNARLSMISKSQSSTEIIKITNCVQPADRLDLVGGYTYILDLLTKHQIKGNSKIFTALAEVMPNSYEQENHLISVVKKSKCKIDVDFYNCIMKKRFVRKNDDEGKEIWKGIVNSKSLQRNCRSWCIYAISVRNFQAGKAFIADITSKQVKPTTVMMHTLIVGILNNRKRWRSKLNNDVFYPDYDYLSYLMEYIKKENVPVDQSIIGVLETASFIPQNYQKWSNLDPHFEKMFQSFKQFYSKWLHEIYITH